MLFPGNSYLEPETVRERFVEQPRRRHRVQSHSVETCRRHCREVCAHALAIWVVAPIVRLERSICNAANPELVFADEEELARHSGSWELAGAGCAYCRI